MININTMDVNTMAVNTMEINMNINAMGQHNGINTVNSHHNEYQRHGYQQSEQGLVLTYFSLDTSSQPGENLHCFSIISTHRLLAILQPRTWLPMRSTPAPQSFISSKKRRITCRCLILLRLAVSLSVIHETSRQ
jgi:hypothetical protein